MGTLPALTARLGEGPVAVPVAEAFRDPDGEVRRYDAAGQPVPTWTGAAVTAGTVIEAAHLTALRAAVLELEK